MRILITGVTGFLGGNLARALAQSHEVYGVTRAGVPDGIVPVVADLAKPFSTADWPAVDAVVHMAQSPRYADFPVAANEVFAIAAQATQLLLDHAVRCGAKRFVFASTGGLYARSGAPLREDSAIEIAAGGLAHYFAAKRSAELLAAAYAGALSTTSARIFFCYGPEQRLPLLVPRLAGRIRDGAAISLQGEGGALMNPVHVDDAVAAFTSLIERGGPPLVNIAGPRAVSLRQMCDALALGLGTSAKYDVDAAAQSPRMIADIGLMEAEVWRPKVDPSDGLARAAATFARA